MVEEIGIDAGGSLTKIAYREQGKFHVKTYPNEDMDELIRWLQMVAPNGRIFLTGGKSAYLKHITGGTVVDEFQALADGTRFLLHEEKRSFADNYLLVSIGTGTSFFHIKSNEYERVLGSGIGGGTWMGLGKLIAGNDKFNDLVQFAAEGNHEKSDLLVRDIYEPNEPPIPGELTAANFGKAHVNEQAKVSDQLAALTQLIGETILQFAGQVASSRKIEKIVFIGSTLDGNAPLKNVLNSFQEMIPYEPVFLNRGAYAGAIGTLMS